MDMENYEFEQAFIYICEGCYNIYDFLIKSESTINFTGRIDKTGADYDHETNLDYVVVCNNCKSLIESIYEVECKDLDVDEMIVLQRVKDNQINKNEDVSEQDIAVLNKIMKKGRVV